MILILMEKHIILVFGLNFGYHIEELLKVINKEDIIIAIGTRL